MTDWTAVHAQMVEVLKAIAVVPDRATYDAAFEPMVKATAAMDAYASDVRKRAGGRHEAASVDRGLPVQGDVDLFGRDRPPDPATPVWTSAEAAARVRVRG